MMEIAFMEEEEGRIEPMKMWRSKSRWRRLKQRHGPKAERLNTWWEFEYTVKIAIEHARPDISTQWIRNNLNT
jgi:hypothetical protein